MLLTFSFYTSFGRRVTSPDVDHISLLSLLDLYAAFDFIDRSILLYRLHYILGVSGTALLGFSHTSLIEIRSSLSMVFPLLLQP